MVSNTRPHNTIFPLALPDGGQEQAIVFGCRCAYLRFALAVSDEMPGLLAKLRVTRAPGGAAVLWLQLWDGRGLTPDGVDALVFAARRVRHTSAPWRVAS